MTATLTAGPVRSRSHRPDPRRATPRRAARADRRGRAAGPLGQRAYRRRRALVGTGLAVFAAGVVLVAPGLGAGAASGSTASAEVAGVRVTAQPGDTLWSLAERHHGQVSLTRYVDALVALNGGPAIQAGQSVLLP